MDNEKGLISTKYLSLVLFVFLSILTLFFAYGYRFDLEERTVLKTSIIDLINHERKIGLYFDGQYLTGELPFQIKSVLPGVYTLKVDKADYVSWERSVRVKEDIVTIVSDILLVPNNLIDFTEQLFSIPENAYSWLGKDYMIVVKEESRQNVYLYSFFERGEWGKELLELKDNNIRQIVTFDERKFVIYFEDDLFVYIDYPLNQYKYFKLPDGVDKVLVDSLTKQVFYLRHGKLMVVDFKELLDDQVNLNSHKIVKEGVNDFEIDGRGNIYYIGYGLLMSSDYGGNLKKMLDIHPKLYTNIAYYKGYGGRGLLIARAGDQSRMLFATFSDGGLSLITDNLKGRIFINSNNEVLYSKISGDIFVYNLQNWHKRYVMNQGGEFDLLGWYDNDGHYVFSADGEVKIADVYNANVWQIIRGTENPSMFDVSKALFLFDKGALTLVDFATNSVLEN